MAASLPRAPKAVSATRVDELDEAEPDGPPAAVADGGFTTYASMLRSGTREALRRPTVRGGVLLAAILYGFTAFDEYFGLLAQEGGASTESVPLLIGLTVAGSLMGALLAGRTAGMRSTTMASAPGSWRGWRSESERCWRGADLVGFAGFALIGLGYGIVTNTTVVAEARLQDAIEGSARATVTSVAGLLSELVALAIYAVVALLSVWLSMAADGRARPSRSRDGPGRTPLAAGRPGRRVINDRVARTTTRPLTQRIVSMIDGDG